MRNKLDRAFALLIAIGSSAMAFGNTGASTNMGGMFSNPGMETVHVLLGMAILQVIIIITLSGVLKVLGGSGSVWADYLKGRRAGVILLIPAALLGTDSHAASFAPVPLVTVVTLFWWLIAVNLLFFIIIVSQIVVLRGMARTVAGEAGPADTVADNDHSFADSVLQRLTRTVKVEQEKDILMHHEYDGIRELDNVLPPWWLWLFYGTIIYAVIYVLNVHVLDLWPHQADEYEQEMAQAKADVAAYMARFGDMVDENTVTLLTDAAAIGSGKAIFQELCKACHGAAGEGNAVGPNLTDAHWIHGGGVKNVFRTITYGVPEKGMISWKSQLKPSEIQAVSSYIISLQGTNPPNAKEPQGEIWKEGGGVPADSTTTVNADTTAVAQQF